MKGRIVVAVLMALLLCCCAIGVQCSTIFVKHDATGSANGTSWADAYTTIGTALSSAAFGDEIWVAAGTYNETITLVSGVGLYGGFAGTESQRDDRDWVTNTATITGSYMVVKVPSGVDTSTIIDGFTITNSYNYYIAGGVYCLGPATISHNVIRDNQVQLQGAGVYCSADAKIVNNVLKGNSSSYGAAIYCSSGAPLIANNTIVDNTATTNGTIYCSNTCTATVSGNIVAYNDKGISVATGGTPILRCNDVYSNSSYNYSGISAGAGDISTDPAFADYANGNYRLLFSSPCIDYGYDSDVLQDQDFGANDRQVDILLRGNSLVDMGAYEFDDPTPPSTPVVTDDGDYTNSIDTLHAAWTSVDQDTGVVGFSYAVGTTPGAADVRSWTSFTYSTADLTATGLQLTYGQTYYISVKSENSAGVQSQAGCSNGITVGTGLRNGNFELGFQTSGVGNYWTSFPSAGINTQWDNTEYHSSGYSQKLYSGTAGWDGGIYQQATNLNVGGSYIASVWIRTSVSGVNCFVGVDPYGSTDSNSPNISWTKKATETTAWQQLSVQVVALSPTMTVFVKIENSDTQSSTVWVDDVTLLRGSVAAWNHTSLTHRQEVILNACSFDRNAVPLFVRIPLSGGEYLVPTTVTVDEITPTGITAVPCTAWSQPSGKVPEVNFTAPGLTAAGTERRFIVYYETTTTPVIYEWRQETWGSRDDVLTRNADAEYTRIQSDTISLERTWNKTSKKLYYGGWYFGASEALKYDSTTMINDFLTQYNAEAPSMNARGQSIIAEALVAPTRVYDRNAGQVSLSFKFQDLEPSATPGYNPLPKHSLEETYRLFEGQPWCEYVITLLSQATTVDFCGHAWDPKGIYLPDGAYDKLWSDTKGDQSMTEDSLGTSMHWLIAYNSVSGKAVGWFSFKPGQLRFDDDADNYPDDNLYDTYEYSLEEDNTYRYLWACENNKDNLVTLFRSMAPGWRLGTTETINGIHINKPTDNQVFLPGDTIAIDVRTPGGLSGLSAQWNRPTQSDIGCNLTETETGKRWEASYTVTDNEDWGQWTLEILQGGNVVATRTVELKPNPTASHPHVLVNSTELADLVAKKDDATYAAQWSRLSTYCNSLPDPQQTLAAGQDVRDYYQKLVNLALAAKIEPQTYSDKMWDYFYTMLRYQDWYKDPMWPGPNDDLTSAHFLTALSLTYDWHYDQLSSTQRQEVRQRLADYAQRMVEDNPWPFDDERMYNTLCNHYWIANTGLAAVSYALNGEMNDTLNAAWQSRCEHAYAQVLNYLSDDGVNPEGIAYSSYGLRNLEIWMEMRRKALSLTGYDPFDDDSWFLNEPYYYLYSILPGGNDNIGGVANFGDCSVDGGLGMKDPMYLLASRLPELEARQVAQWVAKSTDYNPDPRFAAWEYLWHDPTVSPIDVGTLPNWHFFGNQGDANSGGIFAWRSSWDNAASYFSIKCGRSTTSHAQPDAGSFILHRNGIPYIVDFGYSLDKMTNEHNALLVNNTGQAGEGEEWFGDIASGSWGSFDHVLAMGEPSGQENVDAAPGKFFDVVCNPKPAYSSPLTTWTREAVGFGHFIMIRDKLAASSNAQFDLLLHSYETLPYGVAFDYWTNAASDPGPWSYTSPLWIADVRDATPEPANLVVHDLSKETWSSADEATYWVPEYGYDSQLQQFVYNQDYDDYRQGNYLRRTRQDTDTSSLVALGFSDQTTGFSCWSWGDSQSEGVHVSQGTTSVLEILWPLSGSCTNSDGWTVTGDMAGRRYPADLETAYFARSATLAQQGSTVLMSSNAPISLYALMEHTPSVSNQNTAKLSTATQCTVTLYCPNQPTTLTLDSVSTQINWSNNQLTLSLSAGEHILKAY